MLKTSKKAEFRVKSGASCICGFRNVIAKLEAMLRSTQKFDLYNSKKREDPMVNRVHDVMTEI